MEESEPREQDWAAFLVDMPRCRAVTGVLRNSSRTATVRRECEVAIGAAGNEKSTRNPSEEK